MLRALASLLGWMAVLSGLVFVGVSCSTTSPAPAPQMATNVITLTPPGVTPALIVTNVTRAVPMAMAAAPQAVSTNPPAPRTSVSVAFNPYTQPVTGLLVMFGNQSGHYPFKKFLVSTNLAAVTNPTITLTNLDSSLPWFIALAAYITNAQATNTILTNPVTHVAVTNSSYLLQSMLSDEVLFVPSNCPPFVMFTNGSPAVIGYGAATNTFTIYTGATPLAITNQVASFTGTNGPWRYLDPLTKPPSKFYKVVRQ